MIGYKAMYRAYAFSDWISFELDASGTNESRGVSKKRPALLNFLTAMTKSTNITVICPVLSTVAVSFFVVCIFF